VRRTLPVVEQAGSGGSVGAQHFDLGRRLRHGAGNVLVVDSHHLSSRADVGHTSGAVLEGEQPLAGAVESASSQR